MRPLRLLGLATLLLAASLLGGCTSDVESARFDGSLREDGYALFKIDSERQQQTDLVVRITNAEPGARYVLMYSGAAPRSTGWFAIDLDRVSRCGGSTGPHCEVPDGFGYLVDAATAGDDAGAIELRHDVCACDGDDENESWSAWYAVMRVERTGQTSPVHVEVVATKVRGWADEPEIRQLQ